MRRHQRWFPLICLPLAACLFEATRPEGVGQVVVTPGALQLASGAETTLVVSILSTEGRTIRRPIVWSSSDSALVTVSPEGAVSAGFVTAGTAVTVTLRATVQGGAFAAVPVSVAPSPVSTFELSTTPIVLAHGETAQLQPQLRDADGRLLTGRPLSFFARDPTAATVSASGVVTTPGFLGDSRSTWIVVGSGSFLDSVFVTVGSTTVGSIVVAPGTVYLAPGRTQRLAALTLSPSGIPIEGTVASWSSRDPSVATVDTTGLVTAMALGTVSILADVGGSIRDAVVNVNPCGAAPAGTYPIDLRYPNGPPPAAIDTAFQCAVQRLAAIVRSASGAPVTMTNFNAEACLPGLAINETITGLVIFASVEPIDGPGKVLGSAGPCYVRSDDGLPFVGRMRFDSADLGALAANKVLGDVILHEMLHVMGFGTVWNSKSMLSSGISGPLFIGSEARLSCVNYHGGGSLCSSGVPVESCVGIPGCGAGTQLSHWREPLFNSELMTGYLNSGRNPLSRMSIQSLSDIGYTVDASLGEDYSVLSTLLMDGATPLGLRLPEPVLPTHRVDRNGRATPIAY